MELKILICGAGCAGPALAFWLARTGHKVTVVERYPDLRAAGAQIDLRAQGIGVVKRMGLLDAIRGKLIDEAGVAFVDSEGTMLATVMANKSGKGAQSLTSEFEIMRGDLVRILYEATRNDVAYIFGETVERFEQDENRVVAYFSGGSSDSFDLLVGADGQGSRIRQAIQPPNTPDPYRQLGVLTAYFTIPRIETDNSISRAYHSPGGRGIWRRTHNETETQVSLMLKDTSNELSSIPKGSVGQQKDFWAEKFRGAGWECERFLAGLKITDDFYCQDIVQVRTDTWYKGRVVLLGDAAYCPSPTSGMGTTGSFVGAFVLAGEINRSPESLAQALQNYDDVLRPFVNEIQKVSPFLLRLFLPDSQWGIAILHGFLRLLCFLRVPEIMARFSKEEHGGWKLPDYPELKLRT